MISKIQWLHADAANDSAKQPKVAGTCVHLPLAVYTYARFECREPLAPPKKKREKEKKIAPLLTSYLTSPRSPIVYTSHRFLCAAVAPPFCSSFPSRLGVYRYETANKPLHTFSLDPSRQVRQWLIIDSSLTHPSNFDAVVCGTVSRAFLRTIPPLHTQRGALLGQGLPDADWCLQSDAVFPKWGLRHAW
jgi:hypothetical protein